MKPRLHKVFVGTADLRFSSIRLPTLLALIFFSSACQAPPTAGGVRLRVTSPVAGQIEIEGRQFDITPLGPVKLSGLGNEPYDVRLSWSGGEVLALDVPPGELDFSPWLETPPAVRGDLRTIQLRVPGGRTAQVVVIAGEQRVGPLTMSGTKQVDVPDGIDLWVLAIWTEDERATALELVQAGFARNLRGRTLELEPRLLLERNLPVHVDDDPRGWLKAEAAVNGVRSGIVLHQGPVGPQTALGVPVPGEATPSELGIWVEMSSLSLVGELEKRSVHSLLDPAGAGAALAWPTPISITPAFRAFDAAEILSLDAEGFSIATDVDQFSWVELKITALGDCDGQQFTIVGPPERILGMDVPVLSDGLRAPLLEVEMALFVYRDLPYSRRLLGPAHSFLIPRWSQEGSVRRFHGYFRPAPDCQSVQEVGPYVLHESIDACEPFAEPTEAVVTPCGHLVVPTVSDEEGRYCGRFEGGGFRRLTGGLLPVTDRGDGNLEVGTGRARFLLETTDVLSQEPPSVILGGWETYELTETVESIESDNDGPATLIGVGDGRSGVWLSVEADGQVTSVVPNLLFRGHINTVSEDSFEILVEGTSCPDTDRVLTGRWDEASLTLFEELPAPEIDTSRIRSATFTRGPFHTTSSAVP